MSSLTRTTEKNFTSNIAAWYKKHEKFLAEKTKSSTTGKLHYTHPKLRSAYRSLMKHTPYLFTCKKRSKSDTYDTFIRTLMTVSFGQWWRKWFGHFGLKTVNLYSFKKEVFSKFKYTDCKFIYKGVSNEDYIYEISSRYCKTP